MKKRFLCFAFLIVLVLNVAMISGCGDGGDIYFKSLEDFAKKDEIRFANGINNVCYEEDIAADIPNVKFDTYTNWYDTFTEVISGKMDAAFTYSILYQGLKEKYENIRLIKSDVTIPIVAGFSADNYELKAQFDAFTTKAKESGLIDELEAIWIDGYTAESKDIVPFWELPNVNGEFIFAVDASAVPADYVRGNKVTGFEPAIVYEFAKEYGYAVNVIDTQYGAVLSGIASGKYDMSVGIYGYSEERAENMLFSEPYYEDHFGYVVRDDVAANGDSAWAGLSDSVNGNFIRDARWKLFVSGIITTVRIMLVSVISGTVLGAFLYLAARQNRTISKIGDIVYDIFEALPMLVVLLVFFYIVFGKSRISGELVSEIVFGLVFTFTVFHMLKGSVNGVSKGQTEAALALGYPPVKAFFSAILPQAMDTFLPAYKSAIINLLKGTAIVGYVAVNDLTKAGDTIRSLTFDAFMPIISVAVIYFIISKVLVLILDKAFNYNRKARTERFLKGVKR